MGNTHIKSLDGLDEVDGFDEIWEIRDFAINLIANPLGHNEIGKKETICECNTAKCVELKLVKTIYM